MKIAAAADKATNKTGSRGLLHMTLPMATTLFPFESLIFSSQSSAHAAEYRTFSGLRPRLTVMINRKDYYVRNCNPHFWFRRGYFVEVQACANGIFLQVFSPPGALPAPKREWCFLAGRYERRKGKRWFPTGRAISAEGGVAVH